MGDTVIIEDEPKPQPEKDVIVLKPEAKTEKTVTERTTVTKETSED